LQHLCEIFCKKMGETYASYFCFRAVTSSDIALPYHAKWFAAKNKNIYAKFYYAASCV